MCKLDKSYYTKVHFLVEWLNNCFSSYSELQVFISITSLNQCTMAVLVLSHFVFPPESSGNTCIKAKSRTLIQSFKVFRPERCSLKDDTFENSKWVWSGNTTITNCRQPRGTVRKSRSTITRHQEDKLSKAISSLFPIKMIAILKWT